jgi:hypothetical protein
MDVDRRVLSARSTAYAATTATPDLPQTGVVTSIDLPSTGVVTSMEDIMTRSGLSVEELLEVEHQDHIEDQFSAAAAAGEAVAVIVAFVALLVASGTMVRRRNYDPIDTPL